jgi:curved DNA-binding protein CbpA
MRSRDMYPGGINYYEVLGVPRESTATQIKQAFRRLVRKYHPDMTPGVEGTRFRAIVEAYRVLSNPHKRQKYDREITKEIPQYTLR